MDEDGLPVAGVDLNKLLNDLSSAAERKLETVLGQLQQIEAGVCILEAKLDSIPGMTDGITPEPEPEPARAPQPVVTTQPTRVVPDEVDSEVPGPAVSETQPVEEAQVAEPVASLPICKDPRFQMYFDMVKKGVPVPGVQQKMMLSGVDPELIHNPNAPAPPPDPEEED